ncbi:MAG TPA: GNAT family N-acetyltransferase [Candidatus Krumholzibacteria bacterium]|nr:GNAT family N-acetyltransferase [Candidatus Krumholzibacteria bacterium]
MRVVVVDTFPPELDAVADASARATFYHTSTWLTSLAGAYPRLRLRCLLAEEGGRALAYLPYFTTRRGPFESLWSLPFATYGGPVGDPTAAAELLAAYSRQLERRNVLEVNWVDYYNAFEPAGGEVEIALTHVVDIAPGFDVVWRERFDSSRRRRARRAEEAGVVVRRATEASDVRSFVEVYRSRLERWEARSGHPEALFQSLLARGGERVGLYLATHQGDVVGGQINFYHRDTVTSWYGMASPRGNELHAGVLLYATFLREACEAGFGACNLGASLGKESLIAFKRALGGEPHEYRSVTHRRRVGRLLAAARAWRRSR